MSYSYSYLKIVVLYESGVVSGVHLFQRGLDLQDVVYPSHEKCNLAGNRMRRLIKCSKSGAKSCFFCALSNHFFSR